MAAVSSHAGVLVVEDEPTLRASVVRGLSRAVSADVYGVGTVREARAAIRDRAPSILVSDIDLPDGTGLEVVADLESRGIHVPVIFVSSYVRHYADQIPRRPGVEMYEKPISLERLRRIVEQALSRAEPGSPFGAADYIQLAGMGRKSVLIQVRCPDGTTGEIQIRGGEVWSAEDSRGVGMSAFKRLAFLDGHVTCRALAPGEESLRNLEGACEELLMEAARQADEARSGSSAPIVDDGWGDVAPSSVRTAARPVSMPPGPARHLDFDDLYKAGVESLLDRRYPEAFAAFSRAAELKEDPRVVANLKRLVDMGFGK
ncbi:MAG: response regulator [Polyangiaceae bacterium]